MKVWGWLLMALVGISGGLWYIHHNNQSAPYPHTPQWVVLIPGITGDLAKRKLIPALYRLYKKGDQAIIIGTGRREADISLIMKDARAFIDEFDEHSWKAFGELVSYQKLDPKQPAHFKALALTIEEKENVYHLSNKRLVYLSLPSEVYCPVTELLVETGIIVPNKSH